MTKAQKIEKRQARHAQQVARRIEKKRALENSELESEDIDLEAGDTVEPTNTTEEVDVDIDEADDVEGESTEQTLTPHNDEPEEAPALQKDMGMGDMSMPEMNIGGPVSFDELDEQKLAQEKADSVRETTWDVRDLVNNIMSNQMMDTVEKSQAIQKLGADFGDRVTAIMAGNTPDEGNMNIQKDIDLLELEAIIAYDHRHTPVAERMGDFISKAALSYAAKKAKPDSAYAFVTTRGGMKVRKYLIHDKAHVRNALARAAQQIKGGGVGAADAKAALPKIHAAAKRMGIGMGKEFGTTAIVLQKDAKGDWRWIGWPSNNFKDRQNDIISKEAHQEYVAFLDANPDMAPLFMTWHMPGTERKHPADYWTFEKGFLMMSGTLEESEAASLFKALAITDLGMSIQGFGLRESNDPRVITKYRAFEVSDLPIENAANPFTDVSVITKEVDMDKKKYLATILGSEEAAETYMNKAGLKQKELEKAGVEQKDKEGTPAPATETKTVAQAKKQVSTLPADQRILIEAVFKELHVDELSTFVEQAKEAMEKVPVLEGLIKDMQVNQDQKLAEIINPPASRLAWASQQRASAADETIEKDDAKAKRGPSVPWLNEVTGTKPLEAESVSA